MLNKSSKYNLQGKTKNCLNNPALTAEATILLHQKEKKSVTDGKQLRKSINCIRKELNLIII
jgi:hypothetical protein